MAFNNSCNYQPVLNEVLVGAANNGVTSLALTDGQLLIGDSSNPPVAATLTAGANISIASTSGSVTISASTEVVAVDYTNVNTSPYTILITDYYLSVDCSGGAITLNFPNLPSANQIWIVKDRTGSAATNNITITTLGGTLTFDGSTSYVIENNYQAINVLASAVPAYEIY